MSNRSRSPESAAAEKRELLREDLRLANEMIDDARAQLTILVNGRAELERELHALDSEEGL